MRYHVYEIDPYRSYALTVGSRIRPDTEFREHVRERFDQAMGMFDRDPASTHSVAIVQDYDLSETGTDTIPVLNGSRQYLIVAIMYSQPDLLGSEFGDMDDYRREISGMLSVTMGESARVAIVLLRDCSVHVMSVTNPAAATGSSWSETVIQPEIPLETTWDGDGF